MSSELLQQVRVIDPVSQTDQLADVLIADGLIQAVEHQISEWSSDTQLRDCRGLVLGPGLVDLYSHSGEPGFEERETLASLLAAAASGGFTRLSILPDTMPPVDNPSVLVRLLKKGAGSGEQGAGSRGAEEQRSRGAIQQEISSSPLPPIPSAPLPYLPTPHSPLPTPHLYFWGALTLGLQGKQMTELAELAAEDGVVGLADGQPIENLALLRRLLSYLQPLGKPVALWACDRQLMGDGVMRECPESVRFGLPGNPALSETSALASLLELVAQELTPVHIMRVSTARSVRLIQDAKARGLPITASTTWMHLLLDTKALVSYDPNLRLEPPLGTPDDKSALRQALRAGVLDAIAIDHNPYNYEEKTVAFTSAPAGAIGLELALSLLWHHLVETGELSALELWRCLSTRPSECLQLNPSAIAPGLPAELTLFNPQHTWTVERQTLKSRSDNTPWLGQSLSGRVIQTWV